MKNKIKLFLKIFLPVGIWFFLFKPIFSGQAVISSETLQIYSIVKFYFDNLRLGVFPLWDPFVMWGESTQIFLNYVGIYNPFWLLIPLLNAAGMSVYHSFLCSIVIYFWIGQAGFYLLAKTVLGNSRAAYAAFLLFLFSSVSMSMFAQFHPQLLYIPGIWFFYFLISFFKNPSRSGCAGLSLTSAVILTSYLPFYFLTVFTVVGLLITVFHCRAIKRSIPNIIGFLRRHFVLVFISCGIVILSFFPGYYAYRSTVNKEVVAPFRNGNVEKKAGVDFNEYDKVSKNGFAGRMDPEDLYANLDIIQYGDDCFFFVSIFLYLLLISGAVLRLNKVMAVCGLTALFLFFLIMAGGAGFHRFLFDHVPYFKLIRNMHFFLPFFLASMIILASAQLSSHFENIKNLTAKQRGLFLLFIAGAHAGALMFLGGQQYVVFSSFVAIVFSFIFWVILILSQKRSSTSVLLAVLFLSIVVQPCEVIWRHNQRALKASSYSNRELIEACIRVPPKKPVFSYTRPIDSREIGNDDTAHSRIAMKDAPRFFENGFPTFWSYNLTLKEPFEVLQQYTRNKFYVYDDEEASVLVNSVDLKTAAAVQEPSEDFRVVAFDANSIKIRTHYLSEKFLVYTDSYHKNWKAWINGKPVEVCRANMAFKGIRLGLGVNEVVFRYTNPIIRAISLSFVLILVLTFFYLIGVAIKDRNDKDHF